MNKNKKVSKRMIALTIFLLVTTLTTWGIVLGLYYENKYSADESSIKSHVAELSPIALPEYNKIDIKEYPLANLRRYVVRVIADEVTRENLIDISEKIIEEVKDEYVDDGIRAVSENYNIEFDEAREYINKFNRWIYE